MIAIFDDLSGLPALIVVSLVLIAFSYGLGRTMRHGWWILSLLLAVLSVVSFGMAFSNTEPGGNCTTDRGSPLCALGEEFSFVVLGFWGAIAFVDAFLTFFASLIGQEHNKNQRAEQAELEARSQRRKKTPY